MERLKDMESSWINIKVFPKCILPCYLHDPFLHLDLLYRSLETSLYSKIFSLNRTDKMRILNQKWYSHLYLRLLQQDIRPDYSQLNMRAKKGGGGGTWCTHKEKTHPRCNTKSQKPVIRPDNVGPLFWQKNQKFARGRKEKTCKIIATMNSQAMVLPLCLHCQIAVHATFTSTSRVTKIILGQERLNRTELCMFYQKIELV